MSGVDAWVSALVQVVDRTERLLEVADVRVPPEVWSGVARDGYDAAAGRLVRSVVWGQEAVRRAARALVVSADEVAAGGDASAAQVRLAGWLAQSHPGGVEQPRGPRPGPEAGADPGEVLAWWRDLDAVERGEFRVWAGGGLGAVGVVSGRWPSAARDVVNRDALRLDLARTADAPERRTAAATDRALRSSEGARRQLLEYGAQAAEGDGEVVIGVGDVDGADRLVVVVPGMTTTAEDAPRYVGHVDALARAADDVLGGEGGETAGVFWLSYDAPDTAVDPATWTGARAAEAGDALADDLDDVGAVRAAVRGGDDVGRVTVVGHSYGSSVVAQAAEGPGLGVDAVGLVGSPGAGRAESAADLGVGEVYVARDSRDPVAALGDKGWVDRSLVGLGGLGLGADPSTDDFGAVRIHAERPVREVTWSWEGHTSYFDAGSESQVNLARVVAGRGDLVEEAEHAYDPWWGAPRDPEWSREVR